MRNAGGLLNRIWLFVLMGIISSFISTIALAKADFKYVDPANDTTERIVAMTVDFGANAKIDVREDDIRFYLYKPDGDTKLVDDDILKVESAKQPNAVVLLVRERDIALWISSGYSKAEITVRKPESGPEELLKQLFVLQRPKAAKAKVKSL